MKDFTENSEELSLFEKSWVGTALTSLAGLMFFFVCMLLPLVGQSGAQTEHYAANFSTFLTVLLVALVLAGGGLFSKMMRRKEDGSPFPYVSAGLAGLYVAMLLALLLGLFKIWPGF
jgi:hypothetical protein